MKYVAIVLAILLSGCATQLDQVKELNKQNHKVNKIERAITAERDKQVALAGSIAIAEDGITKSEAELEALEIELEKEKAILLDLVK